MIKTKIIIVGIGAVGGYFGGLLAKQFYSHPEIEIVFLARGSNLKAIKNEGLKVIGNHPEFIAKPSMATSNPTEIGIASYIILCTKSYHLEAALEQLKPCVDGNTIFLPLLNGVDSRERIKAIFSHNQVLDGCVYIISRLQQPGVVENLGNIQKLYFGLDNYNDQRVLMLENIFKKAGIEATLSNNISTIIWEKFIFISSIATATTYYDKSIGQILADPIKRQTLANLIEEVKLLTEAKKVSIGKDIGGQILEKLGSLPFDSTSSLHTDFKEKRANNELQTLTGFVVREGSRYKLTVPNYNKMYKLLKNR